ncbi:hypothetical protein J4Q44_G00175570 [Coregonus suidteri]|uniref:MCM C-terminal AAA(+) ATPase domain-containing protein n=1 Tax=Coregonus suidteri TaxID=861788 RepID=A0AAN8LFQ8_9TELE
MKCLDVIVDGYRPVCVMTWRLEDLASFDNEDLPELPVQGCPLRTFRLLDGGPPEEVADEVDPVPVPWEMRQSEQVSRLVKVPGIVISATAGLQGYAPSPKRVATLSRLAWVRCPIDPYFIIPDRCVLCDFQTLRLQESSRDAKVAHAKGRGRDKSAGVGIRSSYLRVVGYSAGPQREQVAGPQGQSPSGRGGAESIGLLPRRLRLRSHVPSLLPSYRSDDLKKAIACLLFSAAPGRGDINLLMLGDPRYTAKSQPARLWRGALPLRAAEMSDARVYLGKGSSCWSDGLCPRGNPVTRGFIRREEAMVLADGGVMREDDRRDNIDFMPTILSRFDMIFIIKDIHDHQRDMTLARHVMNVQSQKCGPRLSASAAEKLKNRYVVMRSGAREHERESDRRASIPITVRQLEAVVRISESLAKMKLQAVAGEEEVDEALRLFQEDQEMISRVEKQLKRRFAIGSQVSEHSMHRPGLHQAEVSEQAIYKVLQPDDEEGRAAAPHAEEEVLGRFTSSATSWAAASSCSREGQLVSGSLTGPLVKAVQVLHLHLQAPVQSMGTSSLFRLRSSYTKTTARQMLVSLRGMRLPAHACTNRQHRS